jgi:hypothetical protein
MKKFIITISERRSLVKKKDEMRLNEVRVDCALVDNARLISSFCIIGDFPFSYEYGNEFSVDKHQTAEDVHSFHFCCRFYFFSFFTHVNEYECLEK